MNSLDKVSPGDVDLQPWKLHNSRDLHGQPATKVHCRKAESPYRWRASRLSALSFLSNLGAASGPDLYDSSYLPYGREYAVI